MPRPGVGNPGNKGNRTNHPSHADILKKAEWHAEIWQEIQDVEALENRVKSRKYAGRDMAALRLLKGDKYVIGKFMDKLVPDLHDMTSGGKTIFAIPSELIEKNDIDQSTS